jgi:hypothetical protein
MTVAREFTKYKFDLMGAQRVMWDKGSTLRGGNYIFFYGKGNENHKLVTVLCRTQNSINS